MSSYKNDTCEKNIHAHDVHAQPVLPAESLCMRLVLVNGCCENVPLPHIIVDFHSNRTYCKFCAILIFCDFVPAIFSSSTFVFNF